MGGAGDNRLSIPEARKRLREIAAATGLQELADIADQMHRRPYRRRGISSRRMTPELGEEIRQYAKAHPTMTIARIAQRFDVNSARVSEALSGDKWT